MEITHARRRLPARIAAALLALFSLVPFFGLVDLSVSIAPSLYPDFADLIVLEATWGLLFSLLVPVPLLAWAVARVEWAAWQLLATAVAVGLAALVTAEPAQAVVAAVIAGAAVLPLSDGHGPAWARPSRAALVLGGVGLAAALVHAWQLLGLRPGGAGDDITWGLGHLAMQAGFALALPAVAVIGLGAAAHRSRGWTLAVAAPALSAVWFGVIGVVHPGLTGSLGVAGGAAAVLWGVAVAAVAAVERRRPETARPRTPSRNGIRGRAASL
ncbi:hypothetical protein [Demequina silvatica]|uniref:hypothetical protein n=1 Tax=Demequina silvatica TaxID=1638988 RepID=UPI0007816C64|nr:hypothetical protein [Demequina silvatica]